MLCALVQRRAPSNLLVNASGIATIAQTCRGSGPLLTSSPRQGCWRPDVPDLERKSSESVAVPVEDKRRRPTTDVPGIQGQHFAIQGVRRLAAIDLSG